MQENKKTIDVGDCLSILKRYLILFIVLAILAGGLMIFYQSVTYQPRYRSTASLYLLNKDTTDGTPEGFYNNLVLSNRLLADCREILTRPSVLKPASAELGYSISKGMVSVFSPSDKEHTCIIDIEVTTESAQKSYDIASAICKYGAVEIPRITEGGQVNFMDLPSIETSPVNSRFSASKILLAAVGVPALVYAFLIVLRIFNDRINNTTDAQSQLDLSVLGVIPNLNGDHRKKRYGKKRGYGKYAPYGPYGPYHQNPANRSRD